jgi:hypothetical protein
VIQEANAGGNGMLDIIVPGFGNATLHHFSPFFGALVPLISNNRSSQRWMRCSGCLRTKSSESMICLLRSDRILRAGMILLCVDCGLCCGP